MWPDSFSPNGAIKLFAMELAHRGGNWELFLPKTSFPKTLENNRCGRNRGDGSRAVKGKALNVFGRHDKTCYTYNTIRVNAGASASELRS